MGRPSEEDLRETAQRAAQAAAAAERLRDALNENR